jgi:hypothetical protein
MPSAALQRAPGRARKVVDGAADFPRSGQTTSSVEGGFGAMLYVTLTTPGTSRMI